MRDDEVETMAKDLGPYKSIEERKDSLYALMAAVCGVGQLAGACATGNRGN